MKGSNVLRCFLVACCALDASGATAFQRATTRTIEIDTREVTRPDIAVAPDGA